jgi:copper(I)-binding protein
MSMRSLKAALMAAGLAVAATAAVTGCTAASGASSIAVPSAYVAEPTALHGTTVGYLVIRNNGAADTLESVTTSIGGTVSLRAPEHPGVQPIVMHSVGSIPVAANALTQLVPNSYHLLITGAGAMTAGKDISLTLTFAHAGKVTILALVTDPQTGGDSYFLN